VASKVSETGFGVIPVLPVADTIKEVSNEKVLSTISRDNLRVAQTPQGFIRSDLVEKYEYATRNFTDDASLVQDAGGKVISVEGSTLGFKITVPSDLAYATKLFSAQRTGIGTDVHRFSSDQNKPLYLGTLLWGGEIGLDGHSDGDAMSHAIVDALLAAAGLGDIGTIFGVDDEKYEDANGEVFLEATLELLREHGWQVVNVSVQLIGNKPKVAPMRIQVQQALTEIIGAPVSVGATTTDGLGFLGDSQGVAAVATALIESRV